jgi:hypothetical protein
LESLAKDYIFLRVAKKQTIKWMKLMFTIWILGWEKDGETRALSGDASACGMPPMGFHDVFDDRKP